MPKKTIITTILIFVGVTIFIFSQQKKDEPVESVLKSIDSEGDRIIFGKIIKIGSDEIILTAGEEARDVVIKIDNSLKIYKMNQKEEGLYKKEVEEFSKKMQEQMEDPSISVSSLPPNMFTAEEADIDGLLDRQAQIVIEIEDNNIRAREVFIQ